LRFLRRQHCEGGCYAPDSQQVSLTLLESVASDEESRTKENARHNAGSAVERISDAGSNEAKRSRQRRQKSGES
jgi:hypothetical protein